MKLSLIKDGRMLAIVDSIPEAHREKITIETEEGYTIEAETEDFHYCHVGAVLDIPSCGRYTVKSVERKPIND